jgi:hypothetical protein
MRPYKRATMIAKSIIKMIENGGGGSAEISMTSVSLPATIFDGLLRDEHTQAEHTAERLRIQGVAFERRMDPPPTVGRSIRARDAL